MDMSWQPGSIRGHVAARMITRSLRSWRAARDDGQATQPPIFRCLGGGDWAILAPVMDSLFHFYEAALGRRLAAGRKAALSHDEALLIAMIDTPRSLTAPFDRDAGRARALDCALSSARVMLSLAMRGRAVG